MSISSESARLRRESKRIVSELRALQARCPHAQSKVIQYANDSDGYSRAWVRFWQTKECPDCGKVWREVYSEGMGPC